MRAPTAALKHAVEWLSAWWVPRLRQDVAADYRKMLTDHPLAAADMARRGFEFDTTFNRNPHFADRNQGMREFWLHVKAMAQITPDEIETLRKETEYVE